MPAFEYVKMGGPFAGEIFTSQGIQAVAPDGTFWAPQEDVPALLQAGAFFAVPGLGSVRIGQYVIYEDNATNYLDIQTPDGAIVPFIVNDAIAAVSQPGPVVTKTANYAIQLNDNQTTFDNADATSAVTLTLPTAAAGLRFGFICATAMTLIIAAKSNNQIAIMSQTSAVNGSAQSAIPYSSISFIVPRGNVNLWTAQSVTGAWTLV